MKTPLTEGTRHRKGRKYSIMSCEKSPTAGKKRTISGRSKTFFAHRLTHPLFEATLQKSATPHGHPSCLGLVEESMRALVVSHDVMDLVSCKLRGILRAQVDNQGPATTTFENAHQAIFQIQPEMIVVVLSPDPERGLETVRKLRQDTTGYILAAGQTADSKLILRALHGGADQYLDEADLEGGLESVLARLQIKHEATVPPGRLLTFLAASGGSGASTLAVNMAVILAKEQQKCALLDFKPGIGDLAALLDLK